MNTPQFRYLRWMKERAPRARISLAFSGMSHPPESIFPVHGLSWRLDVDDSYGYEPLCERIAEHTGLPPERVVVVPGCTYATHLAARALLAPGDVALVESPTYELMVRLPEILGARVRRFQRRLDEGFALPRERLERALEEPMDALLLTVPHNPSGSLLSEAGVAELAALAETHDFHVLADEVYLDFHPGAQRTYPSLAAVSDRFVATGSLTKAHGLANLRIGWVAGPLEVARAVRRLHEYLADRIPAFDSQAGVLAFEVLDRLLERARTVRERNRPLLEEWAGAEPGIELYDAGAGISALARIPEGIDTLAFAEELLDREGVLVAPAEMFGSQGFLRISFGIGTEDLEEGLGALSRQLERSRHRVG